MQQGATQHQELNEDRQRNGLQESPAESLGGPEKKKDVRYATRQSHEPVIQCGSSSIH